MLDHIFIPNYLNLSLHIWTKVGDECFENIKYDIPDEIAKRHFRGELTDEEFVNTIFEPQEQVNEIQPSCSVRHSCWQAVVPHRFMLKLVTVVRSRTCRGERRRNQHYGDSPFIHFNIFERRPRIVYFGGALSIITFMIHLEVHDAPFR